MGLGKKDIFTLSKGQQSNSVKEKQPQEFYKRQTYYLKLSLIEKVMSYAYWERFKISEVVNISLENFFKSKKVKPLPKKK